jgi:hypothetical protein
LDLKFWKGFLAESAHKEFPEVDRVYKAKRVQRAQRRSLCIYINIYVLIYFITVKAYSTWSPANKILSGQCVIANYKQNMVQ